MRIFAFLLAMTALAACTDGRDLDQPPAPLGDFKLGHSIVIAPNIVQGPLSRDATAEEWVEAVDKAFEDRFRRYEGERLYHFGISVEGFVLAQVGVPLVLQPKSAVIYRLTVWDDAAGRKMNLEPHEVTVLEAISEETMIGSGLTQTREEQLENLAILAAKQAEEWLVKRNRDDNWFNGFIPPEPEAEEAAQDDEAPVIPEVAVSEVDAAETVLEETATE